MSLAEPYQTANSSHHTWLKSWGMLLFRGYEPVDVFGPLEALDSLGRMYHIELSMIAETLDPVTSAPLLASMNPLNSTTFQTVLPTHTSDTVPSDLEVLMIPGGAGARSDHLNSTFTFLQQTYPKLKYLFTVCTGSMVAAKAGLLDGKRATSNKAARKAVTASRPQVRWVPRARWVMDGNIWTTSGESAGIDGMLALIECTFGCDVATKVSNQMEYVRHTDPNWDPFADIFNTTWTP